MKILVVGNLYPPVVFGGYEILCAKVVESLRGRGHEITILTSSFGADNAPPEPEVVRSLSLTTPFPKPGEDVGFVDFRLGTMNRVARHNQRLTAQVLAENPVDLVFCWCLNRLSLGPIFAAQAAGLPVCYTINDEHPKQFRSASGLAGFRARIKSVAESWVWPLATFRSLGRVNMIIISQALKKILLNQGLQISEAEVIYQGVSLEQFPFRPLERAEGQPCRLLYAGQLSRAKGVHTLLEALGQLNRSESSNFHLDIVGSGVPAYEAELRSAVAEENLGENVTFVGQVPHERMTEIYQDHHIFIFPSEWEEPFGLTHLEAMACGTAVISTTTGGSAELIRHGRNGLAFQAGDPDDLALRLGELMGDEAERRKLVRGGRTWVEEHHSFEGYVNRVEAFLSMIQEKHQTPP